MATLILQGVGQSVQGSIGAALGALVGNRIDTALFGRGGRQGRALESLTVQSSAYGTPLLRLYGRARVAGSVIWASDLREERHRKSAAKGQPKVETYTYSASFAVALSSRKILRVGRIWADGSLLRGQDGSFKVETGFRLYQGSETQRPDPLIEADKGVNQAPAYRGLAYAVFEDLQLGSFGNRIPSLSFEIIADEGPLPIGAVVKDLITVLVTQEDRSGEPALSGLALGSGNVGDIAAELTPLFNRALFHDGNGVRLGRGAGRWTVNSSALCLSERSDQDTGPAYGRRPLALMPERLEFAYHDPDQDFQPALQVARRGGGRRTVRMDLPVIADSAAAKALVERRMSALWGARRTASLSLPWYGIAMRPGDRVDLDGASWRIVRHRIERGRVRLDLEGEDRVEGAGPEATTFAGAEGAVVRERDLPHGPTHLVVADLPQLGMPPVQAPMLVIAANGSSPAWKRAALMAAAEDGEGWSTIGMTAAPATIGTVQSVLAAGTTDLIDGVNQVEIELLHDELILVDADVDALAGGANLALLGGELIQFGSARPIGPRRYRLSDLWRGRRGTEEAMDSHRPGEDFLLIEDDVLHRMPAEFSFGGARIMALGLADYDDPPVIRVTGTGRALRPLRPCHLDIQSLSDGARRITWVRRSRAGWIWRDEVDAPIGEEHEAYRIRIGPAGGAVRTESVGRAEYVYSVADQNADRANGHHAILIEISQLGDHGASSALGAVIHI